MSFDTCVFLLSSGSVCFCLAELGIFWCRARARCCLCVGALWRLSCRVACVLPGGEY